VQLPLMSLSEHVIHDYAATSLSLKAHPVGFVRNRLIAINVIETKDLVNIPDGATVRVAGLVLVRQRPGTAKGVLFITIEDETSISNLVVWQKTFDKYRKEILQSTLLMVEGKVQKEGEVIHVVVHQCYNLSGFMGELSKSTAKEPALLTLSRADEKDNDNHGYQTKDRRVQAAQGDIFHAGRNFK
jgi:error-prone DNA polymerase